MKKTLMILMTMAMMQSGWTADLNVSGQITATGNITSGNTIKAEGNILATKHIVSQMYFYTPGYVNATLHLRTNGFLRVGSGTVTGDRATALGNLVTAQAQASLVVGQYNIIEGSTNTWVATDPLFVLGNGTSAQNPNNIFTVYKNGNMIISKAQGDILMGEFGE